MTEATKKDEIVAKLRQYPVENGKMVVTDPDVRRNGLLERPKWLNDYSTKDIEAALAEVGLPTVVRISRPIRMRS